MHEGQALRQATLLAGGDRRSYRILGCHVVGERAIEIVQLAAVAMAAQMTVDTLAGVGVSFPTYAEVLVHAAVRATSDLHLPVGGHATQEDAATIAS